MGNKNIIGNLAAFEKNTHVRGDNFWEHHFEAIGHWLGDEFINYIAKANGTKVAYELRTLDLLMLDKELLPLKSSLTASTTSSPIKY